jgi:non-ribosomal peptide synthetase component F
MRHDGPLILTMLAALKAARVFVVLNPTDPSARLRQILDDAEPGLLVTDIANRALASQIAPPNCRVIVYGEALSGPAGVDGNLNLKIAPADPACLIYTSGSTGKPKGVIQTHRNLLHITRSLAHGMNICPEDRILLLASPSGAQGVMNTVCTILDGAALHPFPVMERGVTGLAQWMRARRVTVYVSSASLLRNFVETLKPGEQLPDVRLVRLGSESGTAGDFEKFKRCFREDCLLLHTLASSEAGHIARFCLDRRTELTEKRLPAGHAADGAEILLWDDEDREVPAGETGEIIVKSRFLSPGYWRNESLTAQKFFAAGTDGLRLFRTGDLGRLNTAGLLMHVGRKDAQVKIHGYRVELSEVEDALAGLSEIEKATVGARARSNDDAQLVAYVIPRNGCVPAAENLRQTLRATLPAHMVPTGFIFLEKLPLTPHGKIDREALLRLELPAPAAASREPPETPAEIFLAEIWGHVFARDAIGRRDNFFDLGGDSLLAAMVAARIFDRRGMALDLRAFVECPTLRELAAKIAALGETPSATVASKIARAPRDAPLPLSFQQEQIWRHTRRHQDLTGTGAMSSSRRIRGPLDAEILRECVDYLARRHEMLRTTIDEIAGQPVQIIHAPAPVPLPLSDFSNQPDAAERAMLLLREDTRRPFDLQRGPLVRFNLARIGPEEHWLLVVSHHLATDAWSWKLYFRELGRLYEARQRGQPPPLPDSQPVQYADYAAWQRQQWQPGSPAFRETLAWWSNYYSRPPRPVKSPFAWSYWLRKSFRAGPRAATLPLKRLRKNRAAPPSAGWVWWGIDPAASCRLDQIARQQSATFYMTRLAAFTALLANETGRPDVALGIYLTQRTRLELQEVFGYFVNHAAIRLGCDLKLTFRQWLDQVRQLVGDIQAHGEIPFDLLREELQKTGVKPIGFRVYFDVAEHTAPVRFGGLEWTRHEWIKETMPLAFGITFDQDNEDTRCHAGFDARIYHPARVRNFLHRLARFLDAVSLNPDKPFAEVIAAAANL